MSRFDSSCRCLIAAGTLSCAILTAGCAGPEPAAPTVPQQVFFDEIDEPEELFLGKSLDEIRLLLRQAIDKPVTASFRSASLQTAVKELSQKTGLGIGITPDVPAAGEPRPIDLDLHGMRAKHVLDWLSRLMGCHYVVEGPRTVFITRDRTWAGKDRLQMRSYPAGTFIRQDRAIVGQVDHSREKERLVAALRYALRRTMTGNRDAAIVFDNTGLRLSAVLPPRGHAKLKSILDELKKTRKYETPPPDNTAKERAALRATKLRCDFRKQDIRRIADELGRRAKANIGFDYRLIPHDRRNIALKLGGTTLGKALDELARRAGLGTVIVESDRRIWILGRGQTPKLLQTTGELPWDRAVVRSYYIKRLVGRFGVQMIFDVIRKAVTPGEWDADLPLAFYHSPSGRLIVLHNKQAQRLVAGSLDKMMTLGKVKRSRGAKDE